MFDIALAKLRYSLAKPTLVIITGIKIQYHLTYNSKWTICVLIYKYKISTELDRA